MLSEREKKVTKSIHIKYLKRENFGYEKAGTFSSRKQYSRVREMLLLSYINICIIIKRVLMGIIIITIDFQQEIQQFLMSRAIQLLQLCTNLT